MNATDVVGYAYEASMHCVECTLKRFPLVASEEATDGEGNPVHAVFCGEDSHGQSCDDCGESLDGDTVEQEPERHCIVDGCFGIHVPTRFAAKFRNNDAYAVLHVTPADWDELERGPDVEDYWELWDEICQAAEIIDNETGIHYTLEQDGDLFMVQS